MTPATLRHHVANISVTALLLAALSASATAQERNFKAASVKTPDGLTISAQDWGNPNGPEILFIHGFSQSSLSWIKQVTSDLAKEFHMVTYDLRGHGNSDKPFEPERYKDSKAWADELQAVMDATGIKRPVLAGWSYGGRIMADYLRIYGPGKLAGLNYVDAGQKADPAFVGPNLKNLPLMASEDLAINIAATRAFLRDCFSKQPTAEEYETMLAFNMMVPPKVRLGLSNRPLNIDDILTSSQASCAGDARLGGQEFEPDRRRIHGENDPGRQALGLPGHRPLAFLRGPAALQRRARRLRAQRPERELTSPFHSPKATPAAVPSTLGCEPGRGIISTALSRASIYRARPCRADRCRRMDRALRRRGPGLLRAPDRTRRRAGNAGCP